MDMIERLKRKCWLRGLSLIFGALAFLAFIPSLILLIALNLEEPQEDSGSVEGTFKWLSLLPLLLFAGTILLGLTSFILFRRGDNYSEIITERSIFLGPEKDVLWVISNNSGEEQELTEKPKLRFLWVLDKMKDEIKFSQKASVDCSFKALYKETPVICTLALPFQVEEGTTPLELYRIYGYPTRLREEVGNAMTKILQDLFLERDISGFLTEEQKKELEKKLEQRERKREREQRKEVKERALREFLEGSQVKINAPLQIGWARFKDIELGEEG